MNELLCAYCTYATMEQGRPALSVNTYRNTLILFLAYAADQLGREPLPADITLSLIRRYDAYLKTKKARTGKVGIGQASRNNVVTCIRSFCNYLIEQGVLAENPAEKMKVKVTEKPRQICATEREVVNMFDACRHVRRPFRAALCAAVLATMAYAGLRRSEVCDLYVSDLRMDTEQPTIIVRKGKGNKRREVPLHGEACEYLRNWLHYRAKTEEPYLFVIPVCSHATGAKIVRLTGGRISGILRELSEVGGVHRHLTPHTFRRFMATKLFEMPGSSLAYVRDALGHESILTTEHYIGSHSQKLHDLVQAMTLKNTPETPDVSRTPKAVDNRDKPPSERRRKPNWRRE
jgi:site-specific recombinase XerD